MEEKILKELANINGQLKGFGQRFEKIDQEFEKIDQKFEKIDQRFEKIDQIFEKIDQRFEKIDQRFEEIDQRFEETKEEIITTLRDEFKTNLEIMEEKISKNVSDEITSLCESIKRIQNRKYQGVEEQLRHHEEKALKGVEAFRKVLAS